MRKTDLIAALAAYPDEIEIVFDDEGQGFFPAEIRPVTVFKLDDPRGLPPYQDKDGLAVLQAGGRTGRGSKAGSPRLVLAISRGGS